MAFRQVNRTDHDPPLLYHVEHDPAEKFDVGAEHPEVIAEIQRIKEKHEAGVVPVTSQLDKGY